MRLVGGPAEAPPADTSVPPWFRRRWVYFADQWDPKSPGHDRRVRLAANHASDRHAINKAESRGYSRITGSIIPATFDFYWGPPVSPYDPARAKKLLAEAGYPNGFDAGEYFCDAAFSSLAESVITYLKAAGIQAKLRPLERAAFFKGTPRRSSRTSSRAPAAPSAMRPRALRPSWPRAGPMSTAAMTTSTDSSENRRRRWTPRGEARPCGTSSSSFTRRRCSRRSGKIVVLSGVGLRVEDSGRGHIAGYPFSASYEDVKLKAK